MSLDMQTYTNLASTSQQDLPFDSNIFSSILQANELSTLTCGQSGSLENNCSQNRSCSSSLTNSLVKSTSSLFKSHSSNHLTECPFDLLSPSNSNVTDYKTFNLEPEYDGPYTITCKPTCELEDGLNTPRVVIPSYRKCTSFRKIMDTLGSFPDSDSAAILPNTTNDKHVMNSMDQSDTATFLNTYPMVESTNTDTLLSNHSKSGVSDSCGCGSTPDIITECPDQFHEIERSSLLNVAIPSGSIGFSFDNGSPKSMEDQFSNINKPTIMKADPQKKTPDQTPYQSLFTTSLCALLDEITYSPYMVSNVEIESPLFTRVAQSAYPRQISKWTKSNSTSSLYIMCTPCRSELRDMSSLVCYGIHDMIVDSHRSRTFRSHVLFSEEVYPLRKGVSISHPSTPPSFNTVFTFLFTIVDAAQLGSEICIITLIYLDRLLSNSRFNIHSANWPRMVLGALLLAAKVWDDQAVWNIDFCTIFPDLNVGETNSLERFLIESVYFNVNVKGSTFAKYYFSLTDRFGMRINRPISVREAVRLQAYPNTLTNTISIIPEMRHNSPTLSTNPLEITTTLDLNQLNPESLAAPATLEGLSSGVPIAVTQAKLTGIRRVCSDYLVVNRVPASIM